MPNPLAVVISDIHYNLNTLEVADKCLRQAIEKANELEVPLIIAGDLHDTKANLRGECVKAILDALEDTQGLPRILVGNHDKINEKSDTNSLDFLRYSNMIISHPYYDTFLKVWFIPYQHDADEMRKILGQIPDGSHIIMHQGLHGALAGGYAHDKTSLGATEYKNFKVLSGHYHEHQTIDNFTYIGNPYTLDFSETKHPTKGFLVLNDDFTFERVLTNARKHVIFDISSEIIKTEYTLEPSDIILVRVTGSRAKLSKIDKTVIANKLGITGPFRLDLLPIDSEVTSPTVVSSDASVLFKNIVDESQNLSAEDKSKVKQLWEEYK